MPGILWPIFRKNRRLLHDLPPLGAAVIKRWAREKFGADVIIMIIPHTFGRHLNFNCHLHILVSAAGLRSSDHTWTNSMNYSTESLMPQWRYAVISYLREALKLKLLSSRNDTKLAQTLTAQYERWWSADIGHFSSKEHFLRYAGRYARRPPIAQYRIIENSIEQVSFRTMDHRQKREVVTEYKTESFVRALAAHVPDRYKHTIRYFGLLSPRSKARVGSAVFALLGQRQFAKPARLSWAFSIRRDYGVDPLLDSRGTRMRWIARRKPEASPMPQLHSELGIAPEKLRKRAQRAAA
jgi:hypothetical protein